MHDIGYDMANGTSVNHNGASGVLDCLPMDTRNGGSSSSHTPATPSTLVVLSASGSSVGVGISSIQHQLNLSHHLGQPHQHHHHPAHHMLSHHHSPYSNNYPLQHVGGGGGGVGGLGLANGVGGHHHNIHSDQTKSLQELQHEVGALLEFRDLVIETFPDLKHKMASMSSSSASSSGAAVVGSGGGSGNASVSTTNTLTGGGAMSSSSLASRREWEPGIRVKRKLSQKEPPSTSAAALAAATSAVNVGVGAGAVAAGELSSSSLTRSRSNSHSGKKEPKSGSGGENNNGSVVQDSGFSTETSSSKEGHSASSTNGAMTVAIASNRLSCLESDDELLNLLDVIHRKSNRLREEVEHLQNYERQTLRANATTTATAGGDSDGALGLGKAPAKSSSSAPSSASDGALTPQTFREHVERLSRDDIKQLRRERDRLLDKLAEMEAETLTGRIKAAKMSDQVEELISVKRDLEEQLKLAMAQKLELSSRVQQLQQSQSKSSSSQSDYSSQRNFLSSATTVLSTGGSGSGSGSQQQQELAPSVNRRPNTFQPVVVEQQQQPNTAPLAFHQSAGSDSRQTQQPYQLGRLDGIVSTPGGRNTKCRATDSERITAILLETSVIELQRHLLTLTVQNQVLMQKLDAAGKSKTHLAKRLDKSKDDVEDLRFQLEEKNIELEGTKAQLRVLESRIRSSTPCSATATNSYLNHSQNDYETNRSSASTTLMLSRRGLPSSTSGCVDMSHSSDGRSTTPISHLGQTPSQSQSQQMPPPTVTQISTPSMKAMVHLAMDEIQHHSSSTESAHEHELLQHEHDQLRQALTGQRLLSTSVGGISPFEQKKKAAGGSAASKPSKIPLPGSGKTVTYFTMGGGKPPTGRPAIAGGRSPPSAGSTSGSSVSSKSSLSRSTGNLLYSKSPNSLKRVDSAQSMRKDNHLNNPSSLSTNTSRSSTSSSIPMATTPYGCKSPGASASAAAITTTTTTITTPSPRVLQNSPLPKPKRDSLTSRVRHLDSLSRVHQHSSSNNSNSNGQSNAATPTTPSTAASPIGAGGGGFVVSSASKPTSAIAAHLNSSLRKELQLGSNSFSQGSQQFLRRATGGVPTSSVAATGGGVCSVARRFGGNSTTTVLGAGARFNAARLQEQQANAAAAAAAAAAGNDTASTGSGGGGGGSVNGGASDSDSGKVRTLKSTFLGWLKI